MTLFTRIGAPLWNWEPFIQLDDGPRNLWLALYTTAEAKRIIPGLWHGSIRAMADAAHRPFETTAKNLDALLDAEGSFGQPLVEYDDKNRVLRMTELPDAGEYPDSPTIIKSWWSRFLLVPACQIRDAHIPLVRWILDTGAKLVKRNKSGRPTPAHEEAWGETFATIPVPATRRRGVRRILDADTGNAVQPSLFGPTFGTNTLSRSSPDTVSASVSSSYEAASDSSLRSGLQQNQISTKSPCQIPYPIPYGEGEGDGAGVGGVGEEDPDPDQDHPAPPGSPRPCDPDRAAIETAIRPRPALALVPPAMPFSPERLIAEICTGMGGGPRVRQTVRETLRASLHATIYAIGEAGWGVAEVQLAGKWLASAHGRPSLPQISSGCPPDESVCAWAARPGAVITAIETQLAREREGADRSAFLDALLTGAPG